MLKDYNSGASECKTVEERIESDARYRIHIGKKIQNSSKHFAPGMVMLSKCCNMAYAKCIKENELSYELMGYRPKGRDRRELWTQTELVGRQADVARSTPATEEARPTPATASSSGSKDRPQLPRARVVPTSQRVESPKGKGKGRGKPEFSDKGKSKGKDKGKPEFTERQRQARVC